MNDGFVPFLYRNLDHVLAALLLVSRLGDILTTYFATPRLRLESNPIVRKLGWRFLLATVVFCVVPYFSLAAGLMILMPFLLVAAGNARSIWFARAIGEEEFQALMARAASRSRPIYAILPLCVSAGFVVLSGLVVLLFYPDPEADWGFWIGVGIALYGVIVALYGTLSVRRLFRRAAAQ